MNPVQRAKFKKKAKRKGTELERVRAGLASCLHCSSCVTSRAKEPEPRISFHLVLRGQNQTSRLLLPNLPR